MITLHIEHAITDMETWRAAFDRLEAARKNAGVRTQQVRRPIEDPAYVVVDLDFDDIAAAEKFRDFLEHTVWSSGMSSPALVGRPQTKILESA
jgi:hypothetical protein